MKSALRLVILVFSFLALISACGGGNGSSPNPPPVSTNVWTWVSGSNTVYQAGNYGTKGTAASSNVPSARYGAASWIDSSGNLWLFGGRSYDWDSGFASQLNDLWEYDPATHEWTWVSGSNTFNQAGIYGTQGTADPSNVPGARYSAVSWIDFSGNLWLFGGIGLDSAGNGDTINDLWRYDPTTHEWTWVSGSNTIDQAGIYGTQGTADPSSVPGARCGAVSWIDSSGNLWLFGGIGLDSAGNGDDINDLWRYDPTTNEWTWVSGSNTGGQAGIYGTQGTADPSNVPRATDNAVSWIDSSGNFWLFGGSDYAGYYLNDLWRYDPTTNEWTWVMGINPEKIQGNYERPGIYGTKGTAASPNIPGSRRWAVSWIDSSGKLGLFGGDGRDSAANSSSLNDLWKYDPTTNEWTWVSGSNIGDQTGVYGTQGTAASSNVPGARASAVSWIDSNGKFWLFGGDGQDSAGNSGYLNDLWKYTR